MPFCRTQDSQMGSSSGCPGSSQNPDSGQKEPSGSKAVLRKNVLSWYPAHTWGKGMEREGEVIRKKQRKMSRGKDEQGGELDHSCLKKDVLSPVWFKPERGKQHVGPPPPPTGFFPFLIPGTSPQIFPWKAQASLRNVLTGTASDP